MGLPHLIVDGYNVIAQDEELSALFERDPDTGRARLVDLVASYAAGTHRASIVFDGSSNPLSDGAPHHVANVIVLFSPHGTDADSVIERLARRASDRGEPAVVVTSDREIQWAVMRAGVLRTPSREFLEVARRQARDGLEQRGAGRVTGRVEELVDEDTRRKLWRWARSGRGGSPED